MRTESFPDSTDVRQTVPGRSPPAGRHRGLRTNKRYYKGSNLKDVKRSRWKSIWSGSELERRRPGFEPFFIGKGIFQASGIHRKTTLFPHFFRMILVSAVMVVQNKRSVRLGCPDALISPCTGGEHSGNKISEQRSEVKLS